MISVFEIYKMKPKKRHPININKNKPIELSSIAKYCEYIDYSNENGSSDEFDECDYEIYQILNFKESDDEFIVVNV
jgi:hypothetical protein